MLTLKCGNTPTLRRALNVHPQIPIAVTVNDKGEISVGHPSHNNGGYKLNCRFSLVEKAADVSFSWYYERM